MFEKLNGMLAARKVRLARERYTDYLATVGFYPAGPEATTLIRLKRELELVESQLVASLPSRITSET